ncbi:hypothetical protein GSI_01072 [Ganoderma sinense ZZ0214-1]|uniref:Uncharacterized protein n=1 Tax=Ganoderma sinense ZZ0214-1 TaxID=1077348 RepID=A0A2G8SUX9_9APHY|nr:hypothetical protein GSI_01072 [Ganoderma sinense ZZ0214-1]
MHHVLLHNFRFAFSIGDTTYVILFVLPPSIRYLVNFLTLSLRHLSSGLYFSATHRVVCSRSFFHTMHSGSNSFRLPDPWLSRAPLALAHMFELQIRVVEHWTPCCK